MTDEQIAEMRQFIARWGSGNCWTGTLGTACAMIFALLEERKQLICNSSPTSE